MIVCVCRRISDQAIRRAASEGATSLECLQIDLGVAMQCGRCADCAVQVLHDARRSICAETCVETCVDACDDASIGRIIPIHASLARVGARHGVDA